MFSLRLPISVNNTLTPIPKPHVLSPYPRSQTLPFPSLLPNPKLRATLPCPNVAVGKELPGEPDDRAAISGSLPEPEPFPPELIPELMPKHVAMIMDGNGRWAKMRGLSPSEGHEAGIHRTLRRMIELCRSWGVKVLTVFAFSDANWNRPKVEVDCLLNLYERIIKAETEIFKREGGRISIIGDKSKLPPSLQRMIHNGEESTNESSKFHLIMAINYSGKYDIVQASKMVAKKVKDSEVELEDINESLIEQELETNCTEFSNPDLLIRTSGELRVSNFFLWQLAYTELYFEPKLWPDFDRDEFVEALVSFQRRQRRFGGRQSEN